jgi:hypothetical protein
VSEQDRLTQQDSQREAREACAVWERERWEAGMREAPRLWAEHCFYERQKAASPRRPRTRARGGGRPRARRARAARSSGGDDSSGDSGDESDPPLGGALGGAPRGAA